MESESEKEEQKPIVMLEEALDLANDKASMIELS